MGILFFLLTLLDVSMAGLVHAVLVVPFDFIVSRKVLNAQRFGFIGGRFLETEPFVTEVAAHQLQL